MALAPEAGRRRDARMALAPEVGRRRDARVGLAPWAPPRCARITPASLGMSRA